MPQGEPQTRAVRVIQGKGLLDIEDGVFEYWPGFLDLTKTVRLVWRSRGGLSLFRHHKRANPMAP